MSYVEHLDSCFPGTHMFLAAMALFKFYNRKPFPMLFDPDLDFMYTSAAQKPLKTPTAVHCMKVMMKKSKR